MSQRIDLVVEPIITFDSLVELIVTILVIVIPVLIILNIRGLYLKPQYMERLFVDQFIWDWKRNGYQWFNAKNYWEILEYLRYHADWKAESDYWYFIVLNFRDTFDLLRDINLWR